MRCQYQAHRFGCREDVLKKYSGSIKDMWEFIYGLSVWCKYFNSFAEAFNWIFVSLSSFPYVHDSIVRDLNEWVLLQACFYIKHFLLMTWNVNLKSILNTCWIILNHSIIWVQKWFHMVIETSSPILKEKCMIGISGCNSNAEKIYIGLIWFAGCSIGGG